MIRNNTLINERVDLFNSFIKENGHLRGRDFKASACRGDNGVRWSGRIDFKGNGGVLASFVDWGLLTVVRFDTEHFEIGGTEEKEVLIDYNDKVYLDLKEVPQDTYVMKSIERVPRTIPVKVKVYRLVLSNNDRFSIIQTMGRKIFNLADNTRRY